MLSGIAVERHGYEQYHYCHKHGAHHIVVNILPLIFVSEPCGEAGTYLAKYHKEEVDGGHTRGFLHIEFIPTFLFGRIVAGGDVDGGFHAKSIFDERKQVAHHQHISHKAHHQAAQCQQEEAVGLGAHITQHVHYRESHYTHHLLTAYAHQLVEEGRESRHSHRGDKPHKLYVFRLYAQPACHLSTIG